MGMFDTLHFECPECRETTSYQSKLGERSLRDYNLNDAPLLVIADANDEGKEGRLYCDHCEAELELEVRFVANPKVKNKDRDEDDWRYA